MIAFFGTGLLGSGFVRALLRRGETVHVWNRTADKAHLLEAHGARVFEDPAAAAQGVTRVHLSLSDDSAVDEVLERALPGLALNTVLVDHTTTSAVGTAARVERWIARGFPFVHAPVFMGCLLYTSARCARSMKSARSRTIGAARIESRHRKLTLICIG